MFLGVPPFSNDTMPKPVLERLKFVDYLIITFLKTELLLKFSGNPTPLQLWSGEEFRRRNSQVTGSPTSELLEMLLKLFSQEVLQPEFIKKVLPCSPQSLFSSHIFVSECEELCIVLHQRTASPFIERSLHHKAEAFPGQGGTRSSLSCRTRLYFALHRLTYMLLCYELHSQFCFQE